MCQELAPPKAGYDVVDRDQRESLPDACIQFIRQKRDRPFFAVASFINPHDICYAHAAHIGQTPKSMRHVEQLYRQASALPLDQLPPLPANYVIPASEPEAIESHLSPKAVTPAGTMRSEYDEHQWRIYRWIYCRLTERVDAHIGRILDAVRDAGLEETTLILFTSDHGNMDASHRLASKGLFYDESVRVPFLMKYKGVIPPDRWTINTWSPRVWTFSRLCATTPAQMRRERCWAAACGRLPKARASMTGALSLSPKILGGE